MAALSACGTNASSVATIGNETITQKEYRSALDEAYADPIVGETAKQMGSTYTTSLLNDMVSYEIAQAVADKAGVSVDDAAIDAKIDELLGGQSIEQAQLSYVSQGQAITKDQMRMRLGVLLLSEELGKKATGSTQQQIAQEQLATLKAQRDADPASYTTYDLVLAFTAEQALAQDWQAKASAGMTLQDAVAANPDPTQTGGQPSVGEQQVAGSDLAQSPEVLAQLQAIPVGSTGMIMDGPDQTGAFSYFVVTVKAVTLASDEELQQQADDAASQQFQEAGMTEAAKEAKDIDIEVNPRYGSIERPEQGLPSVTVPKSDTFSEPTSAAPAGGGIPGVPAG